MPKTVMPMAHDDIALLRDGSTVYRAKSPKNCAPIRNAVVILIQGIYDLKPEQARRIVRQRIFTTLSPSEATTGIIKVAAKRMTSALDIYDNSLKTLEGEILIDIESESIWRPQPPELSMSLFKELPKNLPKDTKNGQWMALAKDLVRLVTQSGPQGPRYESDRPIAALLVSSENEFLSAAINTNSKNRTLHAEMNLIASLKDQRIPEGARLFTTLKPCKMCAGMIHDSAQDLASLKILYAEDDPGTHGRNTALDRCAHSVQQQL
jgi:tRNA(Arg) A34 adenosine deaminase TadA